MSCPQHASATAVVYAYTCICISIYTYLYMQIHVFVYVYTCTFCAYFGFNILIAWVGDGPWKDRLSPTCHRDSLPMASDQGIGLQAHLRLKCYPLRFVFVFLFISFFRDCVMNFKVVIGEKTKKNLISYKDWTDNYEQLFLKIKLKLFTCIVLL